MFSERVQRGRSTGWIGLRDEVDDHWQIPRDEAMLLAQLVLIGRCRSICEIGTSYGFSTIHLAAAASAARGPAVHSIDADPEEGTGPRARASKEAGLAGGRDPLMRAMCGTVLAEPQAPGGLRFRRSSMRRKTQSDEYLDCGPGQARPRRAFW